MEKNPVFVLFELRGDFAEGEDDGRGLRLGQGGMVEGMRAQGVRQDIGRAGQEEAHRIGQKGRGRGAVPVEIALDRLDIVFTISARAIEVLIHDLWRGRLQGGDDKARGIASGHPFGFEDAPPWLGPGGCGLGKLRIQRAAGGRTGAMGLREGGAPLVQTARLLHDGCSVAQ